MNDNNNIYIFYEVRVNIFRLRGDVQNYFLEYLKSKVFFGIAKVLMYLINHFMNLI